VAGGTEIGSRQLVVAIAVPRKLNLQLQPGAWGARPEVSVAVEHRSILSDRSGYHVACDDGLG